MASLLIRLVINAAAIYVAAFLVGGVTLDTANWLGVVAVAAVFGIVNAFLKPILKILGLPFILLTLGLFALVINAALFLLTGWLSQQLGLGLRVEDFVAALIGAVVMAITTWVLELVLGAVGLRTKR